MDLFSSLPQYINAIGGLMMASEGASMAIDGGNAQGQAYESAGLAALQGGQYSASVYRNSGKIALESAAYNVVIDQIAVNRKMDTIARQTGMVTSANRATMGMSGLSMGSKSFLAVQNAVLANTERTVLNLKNDALQRQNQIRYSGDLAAMTSENQARSAEYQGAVAQVNYQNQAAMARYQGQVAAYQANSQASRGVGTLLSNAFDSFK